MNIKPCPHCRGVAWIDIHGPYAPKIVCEDCGHEYLFAITSDAKEKAIKHWNNIPREYENDNR